jgi:hypothetical protein
MPGIQIGFDDTRTQLEAGGNCAFNVSHGAAEAARAPGNGIVNSRIITIERDRNIRPILHKRPQEIVVNVGRVREDLDERISLFRGKRNHVR